MKITSMGCMLKLYVADAGSEGRIWTGSANATDAAFSKNVEFLVELRGKKKYCGIDAVLNGGKETEDGKGQVLELFLIPSALLMVPFSIDENESLKHLAELGQERAGESRPISSRFPGC